MKDIHAYILAGGQARRFNKETKGLKKLAGTTLIEHVIARLRPQTKKIAINSADEAYRFLKLELIADILPPFSGPLVGLYSCMKHLHETSDCEFLLLSACDTPFIPKDLCERLSTALPKQCMACVRYEGKMQPTFSLWHRDLLPEIEEMAVEKKAGGFKPLIEALGIRAAMVDYTENQHDNINPFFNINTEADLVKAQELIDHVQR